MNNNLDTIIFSTYIGGASLDRIDDFIIRDNIIYILGTSRSADFPITQNNYSNVIAGEHDIFIMKLSDDGSSLLYSSFIGGSDSESARAIEEINGELFISGTTRSSDFPVSMDAIQDRINGREDIFLLNFNFESSTLIYSSFIGGSSSEYISDMKLNGNKIYLCGKTLSNDYPITPLGFDKQFGGNNEGFFSIINLTTKAIVYSTFIGGNKAEGMSSIGFLNNSILIAGITNSLDFPIYNFDTETPYGNYDFFIISLAHDYKLKNIKIFGGSSEDRIFDMMIFDFGIYICGDTLSNDFPITSNSFQSEYAGLSDGFIMKVSYDLNSTYYSSFIGGGSGDLCYSMDYWDYTIVIGGRTHSSDFPVESSGYDNSYNDEMDIFLIRMQTQTAPLPPSDLTYKSTRSGVYINWSTPLFNGYQEITGYEIHKSINNDTYDLIHQSVDDLSILDQNVYPGNFLSYRIYAINSIGKSQYAEISLKYMIEPTEPTDIMILNGDGYCMLNWDMPVSNGGSQIISFEVYRNNSEGLFELVYEDDSLYMEYNDSDTENGQSYQYKILAENIVGKSDPSDIVIGSPYGVPDRPILRIVNSGDSYVELEWEEPLFDGGRQVEAYHLYCGTNEDNLDLLFAFDQNELNYNHTGLQNGIGYYYEITAINERGESERSEKISITPYGLPSNPINLSSITGDEFIRLDWDSPIDNGGSQITEYLIYRKTRDSDYSFFKELEEKTYNDTDVINGLEYSYKIFTRTAIGESIDGTEISSIPYGLPDPPMNFSINASDEKTVLSWDLPLNNGGSQIIRYNIYRGTNETSLEKIEQIERGTYSYEDTELTNGNTYYYYIESKTAIGVSIPSQMVSAIPLGLPSEPLDIQYQIEGKSVLITWQPPADTGGTNITSYVLFRSKDGSEFERIGKTSGDTFTFVDENLDYNIEYSYYLIASNTIGESEPSAQINVSIDEPSHRNFPIFLIFLIFIILFLVTISGIVIFLIIKRKNNQNGDIEQLSKVPGQKQISDDVSTTQTFDQNNYNE